MHRHNFGRYQTNCLHISVWIYHIFIFNFFWLSLFIFWHFFWQVKLIPHTLQPTFKAIAWKAMNGAFKAAAANVAPTPFAASETSSPMQTAQKLGIYETQMISHRRVAINTPNSSSKSPTIGDHRVRRGAVFFCCRSNCGLVGFLGILIKWDCIQLLWWCN